MDSEIKDYHLVMIGSEAVNYILPLRLTLPFLVSIMKQDFL